MDFLAINKLLHVIAAIIGTLSAVVEEVLYFKDIHDGKIDEAEQVAQRIAIIDYGKIVAEGTTEQLTKQTKTKTLEQAYLKLTGEGIRDELSEDFNGLNVRSVMSRGR